VAGGTFDRSNDARYPATVSDFRLDRFEITVGRFRKFVENQAGWTPGAGTGAHGYLTGGTDGWQSGWTIPTTFAGWDSTSALKCDSTYQTWTSSAGGNESRPINCVSWYQAYAFCIWDGGFLPTEAEWNYAAAGGSEQRQYPWGPTVPGATANLAVYGCYYNGSGSCTGVENIAPVGSVAAGDGKYGQADLAGNVWEWNLDWHASYSSGCNNCANLTAVSNRVGRGGSFYNYAFYMLSSYRDIIDPTTRSLTIGARCARTAL
jgi:formylglycine-generating enzyme required for sulfatase activity